MQKDKNKSLSLEVIRFIITGVIATLIDFGVSYLVASFLNDELGVYKTIICYASGFLVSLVANYLLSAFWVYKNVDKSVNKKSAKNIVLFAFFSLVGLFIGTAMMYGFKKLDKVYINSNFENWLKFLTDKEVEFNFWSFFYACLFFGVKTLVVLVWNYLSRKFFIFKSPEEVNRKK